MYVMSVVLSVVPPGGSFFALSFFFFFCFIRRNSVVSRFYGMPVRHSLRGGGVGVERGPHGTPTTGGGYEEKARAAKGLKTIKLLTTGNRCMTNEIRLDSEKQLFKKTWPSTNSYSF